MTLIEKPFVAREHPGLIFMERASWELYELLLHDRDAAGQHFKITYDNGRMAIMSPLPIHEKLKRLLGRMVEHLDCELKFGLSSYGSTTWRRDDLLVGLEPDECYYIGHDPQFDATKPVDLTVEPAPDLAIEVNITHHPLNRLALYAQLGVKEVWRYAGQDVEIWVLGANGSYDRATESSLVPFMTADVINRFVVILSTSGEQRAIREFQKWVKTLPSPPPPPRQPNG